MGTQTWGDLEIRAINGKLDSSSSDWLYWYQIAGEYGNKTVYVSEWGLKLRDYLGNSLNYALFGDYGGEPTFLGHLGQVFLETETYYDFVSLANSLVNFKIDLNSIINVSITYL